MPFSKEKNRRIYITALVVSFLLIVGSIYLHLRQKTHLGRMSFNLDRDRIKPTSGVDVDTTTWMDENNSKFVEATEENFNTEQNAYIPEASSPEDDDGDGILYASSGQSDINDDVDEDNDEDINEDIEDIIESEINSLIPNDSDSCLRCLCMTINECRPTFCGSGNPCGLFRISKFYWIDGGKPTVAGGSVDNEDQDYLTCVNDAICSASVIRQYYNRFKRDCNKDGLLDCKDQIALHLLGPSGCLTQNLSHIHANRMKSCFIESNLSFYSYSSEENY